MGFKNRVNADEILTGNEIKNLEEGKDISGENPAEILQVISGRADLSEKPAYDTKRLSRDFPQIFKSGGKVRKSPVFMKYDLRQAMRKLNTTKDSIKYTQENRENCEISFVTDVSLIVIKGAAADAIRSNEDYWYDFIDAGWDFYFVGC